jgi:hypothetical protein
MIARALFALGVFIAAIGVSTNTYATSVMQMNLTQLCDRAEQIFSGTVMAISADSVSAGGGEIPVLRYRVRVDDIFKGQFPEEKGMRYAEFTMIGTLQQLKSRPDNLLPTLQQGKQYLLMLAPTGPVGITSTVGLIQGTFSLAINSEKQMMAVNGANNVGLFAGMNAANNNSTLARANAASNLTNHERGAVPYSALAELIRHAVEAN